MLAQIALLLLGFVLLIGGADVFVKASVNIAKRLHISSVVIGLTVVAIGTSAPEAVISVTAAVKGSDSLAISNAIGSNMFNLLLIVGVCAVIKPIAVKFKEMSKDFWVASGSAGMLLIIAAVSIGRGSIPQFAGFLFLLIFAAYITILVRQTLKKKERITAMGGGVVLEENDKEDESDNAGELKRPLALTILLAVAGCALIITGGQVTVNSAVNIATRLGVSEHLIGLSIVALGTSLPELIVSLVACKKGQGEVALGNVVGSSIFNILLVLGLVGTIAPIPVDRTVIFDLIILTAGSLFALLFAYSGQKIVRAEGLLMVLMYIAYMGYSIFRI